jgi:hypothetical protein
MNSNDRLLLSRTDVHGGDANRQGAEHIWVHAELTDVPDAAVRGVARAVLDLGGGERGGAGPELCGDELRVTGGESVRDDQTRVDRWRLDGGLDREELRADHDWHARLPRLPEQIDELLRLAQRRELVEDHHQWWRVAALAHPPVRELIEILGDDPGRATRRPHSRRWLSAKCVTNGLAATSLCNPVISDTCSG